MPLVFVMNMEVDVERQKLLSPGETSNDESGRVRRECLDGDDMIREDTTYQAIPDDRSIEIEPNVENNLIPEEDPDIPGEPVKLIFAFLFLIFGFSASLLSLAITHDRVPKYSPLPDIFLDNLPYQTWGLDASEVIIIISVWTSAVIVIFHKHRTIVARRICLLIGLHYLYRSFTFFVTVLPKPDENFHCEKQLNHTSVVVVLERFVTLATGFGLTINGNYVFCGDYIYSGHSTMLISCYLIIQEYSPKRWFLLHYTFFITSALGIIFLLLERGHYSVDCLIAYWITTRVWWMYHHLANNEGIKAELQSSENRTMSNNNYLKRAWWWHIFCYFERNVPHNLPHKFSWPLPKKVLESRPIQNMKRRFKSSATDSDLDQSRNNLLSTNPVIGYSTISSSTSQNN